MSRKRTNATERLSAILNKLASNNVAAPVADVLASVFQIKDPDPNRTFLLAYTAITGMLERSQKEVETFLAGESFEYSNAFPTLRACFNPKNSGQAWNTYKSHLTVRDVAAVQFTSLHLHSVVPEYEAPEGDLTEIIKAIDDLERAIQEESLPLSSAEKLQKCIDDIRKAVRDYKIWGAEGIDSAFRALAGTLATDQSIQADVRANEAKGGSLRDKIEKAARTIIVICGALHGVHELKHDFLPFLKRHLLPHSAVIEHEPYTGSVIEAQHSDSSSGKK